MRRFLAAAAITCAVSDQGLAAPLVEAWRVAGLANPYSAQFDPNRNVVFVSNLAGEPLAKDGNGFIARIGFKGAMLEPDWVTGLDAPKGMATLGDRLYVADIDQLVAIELATGDVLERLPIPGARDLSDVYAAQRSGRVFVSDRLTDTIWVLQDGRLEVFAQGPELRGPTGLRVNEGRLVVAGAGHAAADGKAAEPGRLSAVNLEDSRIWTLGEGGLEGTLEGLQAIEDEGWYVTDPETGTLYRVDQEGRVVEETALGKGAADLAYLDELGLLLVPMREGDTMVAFKVE